MARRSNDELFDLVKSLNPSEKRYYIQYAKQHQPNTKNDALWLFYAINQQDRLDWISIEKRMLQQGIKSGLPKIKIRLLDQLLKSMQLYTQGNSARNKIIALVTQVEFLQNKGLVYLSGMRIKKAIRLADKYGDKALRQLLFHYEWLMIFHRNQSILSSHLAEASRYNLDQQKEEIRVKEKLQQFNLLATAEPNTNLRQQFKKLLKDLDTVDQNLISPEIYVELLIGKIRYYLQLERNFDNAIQEVDQVICYFKSKPHLTNEYPLSFIRVYYLAVQVYFISSKYSAYKEVRFLPNQLKFRKDWRHYLDWINSIFETGYHLRSYNLTEAGKIVQKSKRNRMELFEGRWRVSGARIHLMNAFYYYLQGEYVSCIDTTQAIIDAPPKVEKPAQAYSLLLQCLCYFNMGEVTLVNSLLYRLQYFVRHKMIHKAIFKILIKLVENRTKDNTKSSQQELLKQYDQAVQQDISYFHRIFDVRLLFQENNNA